jgi:hypothetical protein
MTGNSMRPGWIMALAVLFATSGCSPDTPTTPTATLAVLDANIWTGDVERPLAEGRPTGILKDNAMRSRFVSTRPFRWQSGNNSRPMSASALDGAHPDGWVPEQKITVEEALRAYTVEGAYASFDEDNRGRRAHRFPGKLVGRLVNKVTLSAREGEYLG